MSVTVQPSRQPLAVGLQLAAGLEGLAALHAREARTEDALRLATGASLLAAALRPGLRIGALVNAILGHSLRMVALSVEPEARYRRERLAVELAMSAALGGLLRYAARAARWEG